MLKVPAKNTISKIRISSDAGAAALLEFDVCGRRLGLTLSKGIYAKRMQDAVQISSRCEQE